MTTYTYPSLAQYKLEQVDFRVLIRIVIISFLLLLIMLPLQLIVMIVYAPIAIWNAFTPAKYIKPTVQNPIDTDMEFT